MPVALALLSLIAIVLLALLGELVLGLFVLSRGQGRLDARLLGAYLILHSLPLGFLVSLFLLLALGLAPLDTESDYLTFSTALRLMAFLPGILLAFSLSYPTLWPAFRGRPAWLAVTFIPSFLLSSVSILQGTEWEITVSRQFAGGDLGQVSTNALPIFLILLFLSGSVLAAFFLSRRARAALSSFAASRIRYMARAVALPFALGALILLADFLVVFLLFMISGWDLPVWYSNLEKLLIPLALLLIMLAPPFGLAYGLLRYQVLDIDLRLRFAFKHSMVGAAFVVVFFLVSEGAQALLADRTQSSVLGVLATVPLILFLVPLQRAADRLSRAAMPQADPGDKYREFRRWQIYRATYEDLVVDRRITARERRVLETLAQSLQLDGPAVQTIEAEVEKEQEPRRQDAAAAA